MKRQVVDREGVNRLYNRLRKQITVCFVSVTKKLDIVKHETFYAIASHIFNTFVKQDIIN